MDIRLAAVRCSGVWVSKQWWEQEGIDLEWIQEAEQVVESERVMREMAGEEV